MNTRSPLSLTHFIGGLGWLALVAASLLFLISKGIDKDSVGAIATLLGAAIGAAIPGYFAYRATMQTQQQAERVESHRREDRDTLERRRQEQKREQLVAMLNGLLVEIESNVHVLSGAIRMYYEDGIKMNPPVDPNELFHRTIPLVQTFALESVPAFTTDLSSGLHRHLLNMRYTMLMFREQVREYFLHHDMKARDLNPSNVALVMPMNIEDTQRLLGRFVELKERLQLTHDSLQPLETTNPPSLI